jgi:DNA modification methylase
VIEIDAGMLNEFRRVHTHVNIAGKAFSLAEKRVFVFSPDEDIPLETNTVWSFPDRGRWATHEGDYRGNWSPHVPRNLILRYSRPGELVIDQMMGSGTTLIECRILGRNSIGVDINPDAVMLARSRIDFQVQRDSFGMPSTRTFIGDARDLSSISDQSVHLIATHPPYANIIDYSAGQIEGDISSIRDFDSYISAMRVVAKECFRILKPARHCAILVGDTRRRKHYVPLSARVLEAFLEVGFILREEIIKIQWNVESSRSLWKPAVCDYFKIAHEHLFVFRKAESKEESSLLEPSADWHTKPCNR